VELIPQYHCNGLVAQRDISAGEHLFSEEPFVWAREEGEAHGLSKEQVAELTDKTCTECGRFYTMPKQPELQCQQCHVQYCSAKCKGAAYATHHSILCMQHVNAGFVVPFGHDACSYKIIAKILIDLRHTAAAGSILLATREEVEASMRRVVGQFFAPRFTRALHAFRGGRDVPEALFLDMFQQGYFDGHLAGKYNTMRCAFPASVYGNVFVETCLTESFFDHLMGIFMCNNQHVRVEGKGSNAGHVLVGTSLHETYSKMNHSCTPNIRNIALMTQLGGGGDGSLSMHANIAAKVAEVAAAVAVAAAAAVAAVPVPVVVVLPEVPDDIFLVGVQGEGARVPPLPGVTVSADGVLQMQVQEQAALLPVVVVQVAAVASDTVLVVPVDSGLVAPPAVLVPATIAIAATPLAIPVVVPVIVEERYERVGVSVYATQDIPIGQQVRTCYLPAGSGDGMTWQHRRKALAQYLFQCDCGMCVDGERAALADADY